MKDGSRGFRTGRHFGSVFGNVSEIRRSFEITCERIHFLQELSEISRGARRRCRNNSNGRFIRSLAPQDDYRHLYIDLYREKWTTHSINGTVRAHNYYVLEPFHYAYYAAEGFSKRWCVKQFLHCMYTNVSYSTKTWMQSSVTWGDKVSEHYNSISRDDLTTSCLYILQLI